MSEVSGISNLSTTSSRSEQMTFLMTDLGLDRATAMLMYRAERLQEKGQLQQALRYFERVLSAKPDCEEAVVNARMLREQLSEQAPTLPSVSEHVRAEPVPTQHLQTADLPVTFTRHDKEQWDVYWTEAALNDAALEEAKRVLSEGGIITPFLTLVKNDIETYTPSVYDDPWMDNMYTCRAIVRVTFPPGSSRSQTTNVSVGAGRSNSATSSAASRAFQAAFGFGERSTTLPEAFGFTNEDQSFPQVEPGAEPSVFSDTGSRKSQERGQSMIERLQARSRGGETGNPFLEESCATAAAAAEFQSSKSSSNGRSGPSVAMA